MCFYHYRHWYTVVQSQMITKCTVEDKRPHITLIVLIIKYDYHLKSDNAMIFLFNSSQGYV